MNLFIYFYLFSLVIEVLYSQKVKDEALKWLTFDSKKGGDIVKYKEYKSSTAEGAKIKILHSPNGYKISINLNNNCDDKIKKLYFNDSDLKIIDEEHLGSDEIIIQVEGASIQTQVALADSKNCNEYNSIFQIPVDGSYRLKIIRLRQDYNALRETSLKPKLKYEIFLDTLLDSKLAAYAPNPCSKDIEGYWVANEMFHLLKEPITVKKDVECSNGINRGIFLKTHLVLSEDHAGDKCAYDVEKYSWNRKICSSSYHESRDKYGDIVFVKHPNVTNVRPSHSKNPSWFMGKKTIFIGIKYSLIIP